MKALIVGAGFYGATMARALTDAGWDCLVVERERHVGGHCHTEWVPEAGCHRHVFGPHIFHTASPEIWEFAQRFARFNHFVNRPKVWHQDRIFSFPINLMTLYQLWGVQSPQEAAAVLNQDRVAIGEPANMEEWCLSTIGRTLYSIFIEGYTTKQWGKHPRELPASIVKRVPVRLTFDDNYFTDPYQGIPIGGYTAMVERILDGVPVELNTECLDAEFGNFDRVIYTGAIDEYFGCALGPLEYRTLRFETESVDADDYQGNAVINFTDAAVPFTRIVEHKHFEMVCGTGKTVITREYPDTWAPGRGRYYPVDTAENRALYERYRGLAAKEDRRIVFGGRLGGYRYADMDKTIAAALEQAREILAA